MAKKIKKTKSAPQNGVSRNKVAKVINLTISVGDDDSDRSVPEFVEAVKEALMGGKVNAKNVTVTGQHYLIMKEGSGKMCRVPDYDPDTRDFRPGTFPPSWAGGGPESIRAEKDIASGAGVGARNPEHLRTVQETLAARANGGVGKKLRTRSGTVTGDLGAITRGRKTTSDPVPDDEGEDIVLDLDAVDEAAEGLAEDASRSLLLKLKRAR